MGECASVCAVRRLFQQKVDDLPHMSIFVVAHNDDDVMMMMMIEEMTRGPLVYSNMMMMMASQLATIHCLLFA